MTNTGIKTVAFADWPLRKEILDSIHGMGFMHPTEIQAQAIPLLLQGLDVIGQAKTGTGKTAAFGIPILQNLKPNDQNVQALVLAPARELAEQVGEEIQKIGRLMKVKMATIYGGAKYEPQIRDLHNKPHVVVGTPGRIMDLMRRGNLKIDKVHFVVLDEADRMLDMGFLEDVKWILDRCPSPSQRQSMFFSATMPEAIRELADQFMRDPQFVKGAETPTMTVDTIEQIYYSVGRRNKIWALSRILEHEESGLMIVFCATKRMVDLLADELHRLGYPAEPLHGDLTQSRRNKVLDKFRDSKIKILVATDVAARGLDIEGVTHVINYDLPEDAEIYVHRIGRTGRMGKKGKAISFVSKYDKGQLNLIQRVAGGLIELREPPEAPEGAAAQKEKVRKVIDWEHVSDKYGNVHFKLDIGSNQGATMVKVHKLLRSMSGLPDYAIGNIKVHENDTAFEIPKDSALRVIDGMRRANFEGKKVNCEMVSLQ
jgi:ATP-dependent RNA helicase DeaD